MAEYYGLNEITPQRRKLQAVMASEAVSIERLWNEKTVPVIAFDNSFGEYIAERRDFFRRCERHGKNVTPWAIAKALPAERKRNSIFYWNQGSIPSCCLTSASHAYQFALLYSMALGASVKYDAVNPIYSHFGATGGVMMTGEDLYGASDFINRRGNYPVSAVGDNNLSTPSNFNRFAEVAAEYTVAVVPLENPTPELIFRLSEARLPLFFGSAYFFGRAEKDKNGIGIGSALSSGAHAEACAYGFEKGGERYIYVQNSHGDKYGSDETGRPASGYYVTLKQMATLCESMPRYGSPCVVITRGERSDDLNLIPLDF